MSEPKQRRGSYGRLPADIAAHGYVVDLVQAVTLAADGLGAAVGFHSKNGDYFITVRVPSRTELAEIDRATEARA